MNRMLTTLERWLGAGSFTPDDPNPVAGHKPAGRGDPDKLSHKPPQWMLSIRPALDNHARRHGLDMEWSLTPYHEGGGPAARVVSIWWHSDARSTHSAIHAILNHQQALDGSRTKPRPMTAADICALYRRHGERHGRAEVQLRVSDATYRVIVNEATPQAFQIMLDEVYDPAPASDEASAALSVDDRNPRHPEWQLARGPIEDDPERRRLEASVTLTATSQNDGRAVFIRRLAWTATRSDRLTDGDHSQEDTGSKWREPRAYSPRELAELYDAHPVEGAKLTVELEAYGLMYTHDIDEPDARKLQALLDAVYG
ncbi:MAG: hypothetical protein OXG35_27050 [Acidobacteria bacterium]|nr:hypothetical protein [Acidobacteriota bacterium]